MKLKIKIPKDAVIKVHPELKNIVTVFDKTNKLHFIIVCTKGI